MNVLEINGLTKRFGSKTVLDGLCLSVPAHSVFGFIGRNGAGKTTTMKAVLGLLRPDAGDISVCGERVTYGETKTNRHIGYLPDVPEFYGFMTPREYLALCGEISGLSKAETARRSEEMLNLVGLSEERHRIGGFSRGMKQRLGIAQALLGRPKLLICDEPTSALDPIGRKEILDILRSATAETTVLFSTHILSDVERICTDAAYLDRGRIALQGRIDEIKALHRRNEWIVETVLPADARRLLDAFPTARQTADNRVSVTDEGGTGESLLRYLAEAHIAFERVERSEPDLEALFLEVSGT